MNIFSMGDELAHVLCRGSYWFCLCGCWL